MQGVPGEVRSGDCTWPVCPSAARHIMCPVQTPVPQSVTSSQKGCACQMDAEGGDCTLGNGIFKENQRCGARPVHELVKFLVGLSESGQC